MYPTPMFNSSSESSWNGPEAGSDQLSQSLLLYTGMILKGKIIRMLGFLTRNPAHLVDLGTFTRSVRVRSRHYVGVQSVKIRSIKGSEGKVMDFDSAFNPMHEHTRGRWLNVAKARLSGDELPPVELIQVDQIYFVRDGHHRISVAKALGEEYIDAEVIKWEVQTPDLKKQSSLGRLKAKAVGQFL
jgi:uncharacterized ParB-like nuclease family protein